MKHETYTWAVKKVKTSISKIIKGRKSTNDHIELSCRNFPKVAVFIVFGFDRRLWFRFSSREIFFGKPRTHNNVS
jgi:hypothetical protein